MSQSEKRPEGNTGKKTRKKRAGKDSPLYGCLAAETGKRLREQRISLGYTLKELSDAAGITLSFLSDIEHGRTLPGLETFCILCYLLHLEPRIPEPASPFLPEKLPLKTREIFD